MIEQFNISDLEQMMDLKLETKHKEYINNNGFRVPSVTIVLHKMIEEESLLLWANSLGFQKKKYLETLNYYADIGSKVHKAIENFLHNKEVDKDTPYFPYTAFLDWYNSLISVFQKVEVIGQEESLTSTYYGGTYDLLLNINDRIYLIDFKTSSKITYKFFIQLAAYISLLRDIKNIKVDSILILQLSRDRPEYKEYIMNLNEDKYKDYMYYCERTFFALLYSYYHINYLEEKFNNDYK